MVGVLGIVFIIFVIVLIDGPSLRKKRQKKELWMFSFLLMLALGISAPQCFDVTLPSPIDWIIHLYKPLTVIEKSFQRTAEK